MGEFGLIETGSQRVVHRESGPGVIGFDDEFGGVNVPTLGRHECQDADTFAQVVAHPSDGGVIGFGPGDEVEGQPSAGGEVAGKIKTWRSGLAAGESGTGPVAQDGGPSLKGGGPGAGGEGVGLDEDSHEFDGEQVVAHGVEQFGDRVVGFDVPVGHEVGDESVVTDQGGDHGCVMVVQPEGCGHGGNAGGAEFGVGNALSFTYVVEECRQVEQVGSGGGNMVGGTVLGDLEAVLVDGLGVDGFARDEAANVVPGGDEGGP